MQRAMEKERDRERGRERQRDARLSDRDTRTSEVWDGSLGLRVGRLSRIPTVGVGDRLGEEDDSNVRKFIKGGRKVDIVCVDGSSSSDKALLHAFEGKPKDHRLMLLHGVYSPASVPFRVDNEINHLADHYHEMCERAGRECHVAYFNFKSNREFGEGVCQFQNYGNVRSITIGKRAHTSSLRRMMLGSSSQSVMEHCDIPVTLVAERERGL